jgi:NADH-quinone oxidoreductase subunit J
MLTSYDFIFYLLALVALLAAFGVVTAVSPIYSALYLVLVMCDFACLFLMLNAYFVAGVQVVVYAGAVVVLFVMVVMLFNLHHEKEAFARGKISGFFKLAAAGMFCGLLATTLYTFTGPEAIKSLPAIGGADSTRQMAQLLFTDYVFGFEAISILILLVAVGAVTIAQFRGGTHAKS